MVIGKWLKKLIEAWNDTKLAEKCGLKRSDICIHVTDGNRYMTFSPYNFPGKRKCIKCGEFYD